MLTTLPAKVRKVAYAVYAVVGVVLGALQVAYLNIAGQPQWLTVALAVFGFLGTALGVTAASNTPSHTLETLQRNARKAQARDARGRFVSKP